jgi:hypothetical protein
LREALDITGTKGESDLTLKWGMLRLSHRRPRGV